MQLTPKLSNHLFLDTDNQKTQELKHISHIYSLFITNVQIVTLYWKIDYFVNRQTSELMLWSYWVRQPRCKIFNIVFFRTFSLEQKKKNLIYDVQSIFEVTWPGPTLTLTKRLYLVNHCSFLYETLRKVGYD